MVSRNEHTGALIQSKANTKQFEQNFERIFGKKDIPTISDNSISSEYANDGRVYYVDKYKHSNHLLKDDDMGFNDNV